MIWSNTGESVHWQSRNSFCKQEATWYRYYQWEWSEILWDPVVKRRQDRGAVYVTMNTFCSVWFIFAHILYTVRDRILWNYAWKTIVVILSKLESCTDNSLGIWCITHSCNLYSNTFPSKFSLILWQDGMTSYFACNTFPFVIRSSKLLLLFFPRAHKHTFLQRFS